MKKRIVLGLVVLFALGAVLPALAEGKDCGCSFSVQAGERTQEVGGKSGHSSHDGLHRAAERSPAVTHTHG